MYATKMSGYHEFFFHSSLFVLAFYLLAGALKNQNSPSQATSRPYSTLSGFFGPQSISSRGCTHEIVIQEVQDLITISCISIDPSYISSLFHLAFPMTEVASPSKLQCQTGQFRHNCNKFLWLANGLVNLSLVIFEVVYIKLVSKRRALYCHPDKRQFVFQYARSSRARILFVVMRKLAPLLSFISTYLFSPLLSTPFH